MSKVFSSPATFVGGSLAGALLLAAWFGAFTREPEPAPHPTPTPVRRVAAPAPNLAAEPAPAPAQPQPQPVALAPTCPAQALTTARGDGDGRFALHSALSGGERVEPSAYVTVARESAGEGRVRDAEVALLAACHAQERAGGSHSVALADLKSQIAQHYVALAASEPTGGVREQLLQRAATLLSESAITYSAALGRQASKTRMTEQRLASLHDPATLQRARAAAETRVMGAAPHSADEAQAARGTPARDLISSDPELAQLESDLQRLHAQASTVTRDRSGLRRRDGQALAQRDAACQDKACLLRWYAQRRGQLLAEF